jgi:hypothetical protein
MVNFLLTLLCVLVFALAGGGKIFAAECILKLKDRKGDFGRFSARGDTLPDSALLFAFLTGKTYAGCMEYSEVTPGVFGTPKIVVVDDVPNNDIDYKAVLSYKDYSVETNPVVRKLVISAPTVGSVTGICVVIEQNTQAIPAIPPDGVDGKGGNTIITEWETALGATAGTFKFLSGGFIKVRR